MIRILMNVPILISCSFRGGRGSSMGTMGRLHLLRYDCELEGA